jgi:predicted DNA-binding transcriptional regulator AlpA
MKPDDDTIALVSGEELAQQLGYSLCTIHRWVAAGKFPKPIYLMDGSPARWRVSAIAAYLNKRRLARRVKPKPRGMLKQVAPRERAEA